MALNYNERTGEFEDDSTHKNNYGNKKRSNKSNEEFSIIVHVVRLIGLLLFCNFSGFFSIEGYFEDSVAIMTYNIIAIGVWIYYIIKGGNDE